MKIKINDNFNSLLNFIRAADHEITFYELIQFVIDYDLFKEFYPNYHLFRDILLEHNQDIRSGKWIPVK